LSRLFGHNRVWRGSSYLTRISLGPRSDPHPTFSRGLGKVRDSVNCLFAKATPPPEAARFLGVLYFRRDVAGQCRLNRGPYAHVGGVPCCVRNPLLISPANAIA
jgi:hypothetical protein